VVDFFDQLIAWADYWLKDIDNGMIDTAPVRVFVMGENRWRDESEWPPIRAVPTDFYLHSGGSANRPSGDGLLSTVPQGDESSDAYSYDPRNPVMSMFSKRGHDEPHDLRPLDRRRDVLVYQTAPLVEAVEVTGYPVVTLCASSSAVDTDFIVRLVEVHPDGFSQNLSYGIVRARYRNGFESPGLMTPGQVYEFTIEMLPTGNVFLPGHRIRLDVTSSDFPNFDRNHNTGGDDWQDAELVTAHQTVHHDASWQSRVTLPIVPR
jgi:putative CocE/NonD family hydrolase